MPVLDVNAVKERAHQELHQEAFKSAVEEHKKKIKARRLHLFPKRIVFQSPIRLEDWYKPKNS